MENQQSNQPVKCSNGCGFFGNPLMQNYCSKCFRDLGLDKKGQSSHQSSSPINISSSSSMASSSPPSSYSTSPSHAAVSNVPPTEGAPGAPIEAPTPAQSAQPDTTRCFSCSRKVGLLGFKCRCDFVFCSKHRYADLHTCSFDYQGMHKANLEKQNPQIVAAKVQKI